MNFVYLAVPYSHPNPAMRDLRYRMVTEYAARAMVAGWNVYSPISHTHPMAEFDLPKETEWWLPRDFAFLRHATELWVLTLPGWEDSRGVAAERRYATTHGIPVRFMEYDDAIHSPIPAH